MSKVPEITVKELDAMRKSGEDFVLIDVREQKEFDACNMGGLLMPLSTLEDHINEVPKGKKLVVHCHLGGRSAAAVAMLMEAGYQNVYNLKGGISAWINEIDPNLKK